MTNKPKCEYNPKHKLKFIECDCVSCKCCSDTCSCDDSYVGSWECTVCEARKERERMKELRKTTNIVVDAEDVIIQKGHIISAWKPDVRMHQFPHGGKPLKNGDKANAGKDGYLIKAKNGQFLVIK